MRLNTLHKKGFTLVEIMIVVAIIGLLAAIAIPNFVKARATAQKNACINNLRQIDGAIQQYALEQKQAASAPVHMSDVLPYLKNQPICPAGGNKTPDQCYQVTDCQTSPTCLIDPANHVLPP